MKRIIILAALFFCVSVVPVSAQTLSPSMRVTLLAQLKEGSLLHNGWLGTLIATTQLSV